ncbi:hypothetical protein [Bacillus sp. P14.5]|uniref:hypothetical protein n=1 Tax=Bacillus sp. P14.5 TaxID=1983400 RepID=UPI000DEBC2FB|nr:hypothetical protein [Bacillus sp. P14.5]
MINQRPNHIQLDNEEIKTLKLFLPLFYFLLIGYDLFYYYIFKYYEDKKMGLPEDGMGYWFHLILILILPVSIYLTKKEKFIP